LVHQRFPNATAEDLKAAHAFAYGGCIIQDMGYYPFGSHFFTDLTHYVRSGAFVEAMLRNAQNINDYAFALGSLAHYAADNNGHRIAINRAVPLLYPKLQRKFGNEVTYEDDPGAHLKTEFGIDVLQVARGRYVSDRYRQFIGFEVSKPLLERAFLETYGLELDDVFGDVDLAIGSYRRSVSSIIPKMTRVAWELKKDDIEKSIPGITRQTFLYNLSRASFEKQWGKNYRESGFGTKVIAFLVRWVPKVGPFKALEFRTPTPEVEKLFAQSIDATLAQYRSLLAAEAARSLQLANERASCKKEGRGAFSLFLQGHFAGRETEGVGGHGAHLPKDPFQLAIVLNPFAVDREFLIGQLQPDGFTALFAGPVVIGTMAAFRILLAPAVGIATSESSRLEAALTDEAEGL
jgi:zinc dependent phospholipase C